MRQETCSTLMSPTQALHPEHCHPILFRGRNDVLDEAAVVCVHHVDRDQSRVPLIGAAEHLEMNPGMLVAGEAEVPDLPFFLCFESRSQAAALEDPFRVVIVNEFMELPEVHVIRLQPAQAIFEATPGTLVVPLTVLRH